MREELENNKTAIFMALILGIVIGVNWPKIKGKLKPFLELLESKYGDLSFASLGALAAQKEKIEDMFAGYIAKQSSKKTAKQSSKKTAKRKPPQAGGRRARAV